LKFAYFTASILEDTTDQNTMQSSGSSSSNSSSNPNIKIENASSYYCNSYAGSLQAAPPGIAAITERSPSSMIVSGGYSKSTLKSKATLKINNVLNSVDSNTGFSVILRPGEQINSGNPGHDSLSIQRYATHPATRLVSVSQSRQDEVLLHQQQQQQQQQHNAANPASVFYHNSPSGAPDVNGQGDNQHDSAEGSSGSGVVGASSKYADQVNGHDTLSDFVTFVCQESDQGPQSSQSHRSGSPKSQSYPQYNTMLPPPPLPPMARPVAIIRSSDLSMVSSPPTSITPPTTMSSPHQEHQDSQLHNDMNSSPPPLSPQMDRKSLTRISSPYSTGREYTFNHFHTQPTQVSSNSGRAVIDTKFLLTAL
jgi:hypothetical protein